MSLLALVTNGLLAPVGGDGSGVGSYVQIGNLLPSDQPISLVPSDDLQLSLENTPTKITLSSESRKLAYVA